MINLRRIACIALVMLVGQGNADYQADCGDPYDTDGKPGPWDYNDPFNWTQQSIPGSQRFKSRMDIFDKAHFTNDVRNLVSGVKKVEPLSDLNQILTVMPNHHEALFVITKLYEKTDGGMLLQKDKLHLRKNFSARSLKAECYFERAIRFTPDDPFVRMLTGIFEHKRKNYRAAIDNYSQAEAQFAKTKRMNPELFYNIALAYLKLDDLENARAYAEKAYSSGYPLPGLKHLLAN